MLIPMLTRFDHTLSKGILWKDQLWEEKVPVYSYISLETTTAKVWLTRFKTYCYKYHAKTWKRHVKVWKCLYKYTNYVTLSTECKKCAKNMRHFWIGLLKVNTSCFWIKIDCTSINEYKTMHSALCTFKYTLSTNKWCYGHIPIF